MHLSSLTLTGFRSYQKAQFDFEKPTTVIVGANAVGKTNILEAIYLLASGLSFRAEKIEEMVHWEAEVAHVTGEVVGKPQLDSEAAKDLLQIVLTRGEVQGKRVQKRTFKVNGVGRRRSDFTGNLKAVVFRPEDLELISGSPSKRRAFLDQVLTQVDVEYARSWHSYEKGLRRRNRLLDLIKNGETDRRALWFWDELLVRTGGVITLKRQELVDYMNANPIMKQMLKIVYDSSKISPARLKQYEKEEVAAGYTLVGPHKDDFSLNVTERDLAAFGSRGEQRMAVLWLKLHELNYIEQVSSERPLLLLDDIFSELDTEHDDMVMELLGKQQSVITTTDEDSRFQKKSDLALLRLLQ